MRRSGETQLVCVRPAGEVRCLPRPRNQNFIFSSSAVFHILDATFLSINFLVFRFRLSAFLLSLLHHVACLFCLLARLVSVVGNVGSLPQYCGYRLNPTTFSSRIYPQARIRLGFKAWERDCHQHSLAKQAVSDIFDFSRLCWLSQTHVGYRGGLRGRHCHETPRGPWSQRPQ